MTVLMFQERFADIVASGEKRQTIRPKRKVPVEIGDSLSLRKWEGKAYRSKQVELLAAKCSEISRITIYDGGGITLNGLNMCEADKHVLAKADGFDDFDEMIHWFYRTHGLPFEGVLIQW